jgi:hypothetical protein
MPLVIAVASPSISSAAMYNYQGKVMSATVRVSGAGMSPSNQKIVEKNTANTNNMSYAFNNVSGFMSKGMISFGDTGMWIGFGGTASAVSISKYQDNLQMGGVIRLNGDVMFDVATATYTGTGDVVEFSGPMTLRGSMMRGNVIGGMMGTTMMGPGGGGMGGGTTGGFGTYSGIGGGMMPGWGGGFGNLSSVMGGRMTGWNSGVMQGYMNSGAARSWINAESAAMVPVVNGVPDRSNPVPVTLQIMLSTMRMTSSTPAP